MCHCQECLCDGAGEAEARQVAAAQSGRHSSEAAAGQPEGLAGCGAAQTPQASRPHAPAVKAPAQPQASCFPQVMHLLRHALSAQVQPMKHMLQCLSLLSINFAHCTCTQRILSQAQDLTCKPSKSFQPLHVLFSVPTLYFGVSIARSNASKTIAQLGMPAKPLQTLKCQQNHCRNWDASSYIAEIGMVVQVACSMAGAVPGPGEVARLHLSQAHLLPPLQAVVLGKL